MAYILARNGGHNARLMTTFVDKTELSSSPCFPKTFYLARQDDDSIFYSEKIIFCHKTPRKLELVFIPVGPWKS